MARRGDSLREHLLWTAKEVFLQLGYEKTTMDEVANRAGASKRSLYSFFESKEKLFLAVTNLLQELFLSLIKDPAVYSHKPAEALATFCGRYLEALLYQSQIRMLRISMAESERFPEQARQYYDVLFRQVHLRLGAYLAANFGLTSRAGLHAAEGLLNRILYPKLTRALFGIDPLGTAIDQTDLSPEFDLKGVRRAVLETIEGLKTSRHRPSPIPL